MKNKFIFKLLPVLALSPVLTIAEINNQTAPEMSVDDATQMFFATPILEEAYISASPENRNDSINVGGLGVDGSKKELIIKLAQEIAANQHGAVDSLLIAHKDKLVFESYYRRGRVDLPHHQASATKGYTSLAIGRAIQMGYLTMADLDKPLVSFLTELDPTKHVAGTELITLHKAMTMRSGLRISEEQREKFELDPRQLVGQKQVQTYLEHSQPISLESQSFRYQFDPVLVMQVLEAVVPGTAKDFITTELFDKLDFTEYRLRTEISGMPTNAIITSRDMLKFGILVSDKGKWNGEQLIPEAFIAKATNTIVEGVPGVEDIFFVGDKVTKPGYGYFWWQADMTVGDKTYFTTSAQGGGGQYIILIDDVDLIVVTTGHDGDVEPMPLTAERILPAFIP